MHTVSDVVGFWLAVDVYDLSLFACLWGDSPRGPLPPHSRGFQITHDAPRSAGLLWTSDQLVAETSAST